MERFSETASDPALPDGLAQAHLRPSRWLPLRTALLVAVIAVPIGLALAGEAGGSWIKPLTSAGGGVTMTVDTPMVIRSGNSFETRLTITATRPVADLVVTVDDALWKRVGIDTQMPEPESAKWEKGALRFSYGPLAAGDTMVVKFNGYTQIYGLRWLTGAYRVSDGDRPLLNQPVSVKVLP